MSGTWLSTVSVIIQVVRYLKKKFLTTFIMTLGQGCVSETLKIFSLAKGRKRQAGLHARARHHSWMCWTGLDIKIKYD